MGARRYRRGGFGQMAGAAFYVVAVANVAATADPVRKFDHPFAALRLRGGPIRCREQCVQLVSAVAGGSPFFYQAGQGCEHLRGVELSGWASPCS